MLMKLYKVPVTFEVYIREKQLADLDNEVRKSLETVIDIDGKEALTLGVIGMPEELSREEARDFLPSATDAYQTQLMAIADGLTDDPNVTAEQAQEILRRMF